MYKKQSVEQPTPGVAVSFDECEECLNKEVKRKMREPRVSVSPTPSDVSTTLLPLDQLKDLLKVVLHSSTRKLKRKSKTQP